MKTQISLALVIAFTLFSCGKKYECEGKVLSKHNVPMPNTAVQFPYMMGGKEQTAGEYGTTTDKNGHFAFSIKLPRNRAIKGAYVQTIDSGSVSTSTISNGQKDIVLNLNQ